MKKVIILGGGLTGLSAADILAEKYEVTIIERDSVLGGLAASFEIDGKKIPRYYHHIFSHDCVTQSYLKRAGLLEGMNWQKIKMAICSGGKIFNFTTPQSLLKLNLLSLFGRIRYGLFGMYVFTFMRPDAIPDETDAREWLMKYAGKEVTEKLFHELYAVNKFNIPLTSISAKQFAHRLKAKEAMGVFGYPRQGLDLMIECLEKSISQKKGNIIKNANIEKINLTDNTLKVNGKEFKADAIINTLPLPTFLKLANGLPKEYIAQVSKVRYCPVVGIVVGTKNFLGEHYWYNLLKERVHIIMQHSRLYDGYKEKVSWVSRYGGSEEDMSLSDEQIKNAYLGVMYKYFPDAEVIWTKVFKEWYAEPIYDKDYSSYKPDYRTPVKGLYHAGIAVTYPEIRNMNTVLKSGMKVARIVEEDLK